jgi:hypothetical protein
MWLTAEQPCGKRLAPILRTWLPYYERRYGALSGRQRKLLWATIRVPRWHSGKHLGPEVAHGT